MMNRGQSLPSVHLAIRQAWRRRVLPAFASGERVQMLAALVIANTSLDELLATKGYQGATEAERFYAARHSFSCYADVCAARKLRNLAVHHLDFNPAQAACGVAIGAYARALRDHGIQIEWPVPVDEPEVRVLRSQPTRKAAREAPGEHTDQFIASARVRAIGSGI